MLVLTRKYQEKIRIGDNITITVLRTKGKAVRLGIEAPANVPVVRGELKFESDVDEEPAIAAAGPAGMPTAARGKRTRQVAAESAWTTRSRQGDVASHGLQEAEIEHRRVPRGKVGQVLPRLIPGNGALARVARSAVGDRLMPWHSLRRHQLCEDAISAVGSTRIRFARLRYVNRQHCARLQSGCESSSENSPARQVARTARGALPKYSADVDAR